MDSRCAHRANLVNFLHGDYLRVAVPPGRGELRDYHTRDVAQCFRRGYRASNIPTVLEALPDGIGVADMPVIDHFNYIPKAQDLDYDRDAMALFQLSGWSLPAFDHWPPFLSSRSGPPVTTCKVNEHDVREPDMLADDPMEIQEGDQSLILVTPLHFYKNCILSGSNSQQQRERMKAECCTYVLGTQIMIVFHFVNQIDLFDFFLTLGAGLTLSRKLGMIALIRMPAWTSSLSNPRREEEVTVHERYPM